MGVGSRARALGLVGRTGFWACVACWPVRGDKAGTGRVVADPGCRMGRHAACGSAPLAWLTGLTSLLDARSGRSILVPWSGLRSLRVSSICQAGSGATGVVGLLTRAVAIARHPHRAIRSPRHRFVIPWRRQAGAGRWRWGKGGRGQSFNFNI